LTKIKKSIDYEKTPNITLNTLLGSSISQTNFANLIHRLLCFAAVQQCPPYYAGYPPETCIFGIIFFIKYINFFCPVSSNGNVVPKFSIS
jgi:hypothetical protein